MRHLSIALIAAAVALASCSSNKPTRRVRIAAASDLSRAFDELGKEFASRTGITPEFSFGSSGLLSKQIAQGAPYFLFASANQQFVRQVVDAGRCDASSAALYARGRLVVWTPNGIPAPVKIEDLAEPRFKRIAVANPEHAPYGLAAKQALDKLALWSQIADRVVLAENIQATMLYARERNAEAAVVALSLAVVSDGGSYLAIDPALHEPLDQQLVVCGKGDEADAARQFAAFVGSPEGREVMTRYGFVLPATP